MRPTGCTCVGLHDDLGHHHLPGLARRRAPRAESRMSWREAPVLGHDITHAVLLDAAGRRRACARARALRRFCLRAGRAGRCRSRAPSRDRRGAPCASPTGSRNRSGAASSRIRKPKPSRMALHAAADQIELLHDAERAAPVAHDLAVALHRVRDAAESVVSRRRRCRAA